MKIPCNIIRDLLPLYVEDMLSEDSTTMVQEHIQQCQSCRAYLDEIGDFNEMPMDRDPAPLLRIKSTLQKKKMQTVLLSVLFSIILFLIGMQFLTAPEYLSFSDKSVSVRELDSDLMILQFDNRVYGYDIDKYLSDDNASYVYHITAWNSIWNSHIKKSNVDNILLNPNGEKVQAIYYCQTDGSEDILIYGEAINPNGGVVTLPRLVLANYFFVALVFAIICGLMMLLLRQNKRVLDYILKFFFLPIAYILAHLMVKGFMASSYTAKRDFYAILLLMIPIYIALRLLLLLQSKAKNR